MKVTGEEGLSFQRPPVLLTGRSGAFQAKECSGSSQPDRSWGWRPSGLLCVVASQNAAGGSWQLGFWSQPVWIPTPQLLLSSSEPLGDVIHLSGLNFLIREQVSFPHKAFRIKCTDIGKELRQCLACTKSSINISIISAQRPFQTFKQQKLSEDNFGQTGAEMALWPVLRGLSLGAHDT